VALDAYEQRIDTLLGRLGPDKLALAVRIAEVPEHIRGFAHVKEAHVARATAAWAELEREWTAAPPALAKVA